MLFKEVSSMKKKLNKYDLYLQATYISRQTTLEKMIPYNINVKNSNVRSSRKTAIVKVISGYKAKHALWRQKNI